MIESDLLSQFVTKISLNKNQYNYYISFPMNFYNLWLVACSNFYKNSGCKLFSY